jgi:hypothetical protein
MSENMLFWLSVMTYCLGLLLSAGVAWLGRRLVWSRVRHPQYIEDLIMGLAEKDSQSRRDVLHEVSEMLADYCARRNEFWTTFGQIILSVLIATLITALLLTKVIEPDAGLPILSGISGFAIAKTVSTARAGRGPRIEG